MDSQMHQDQFDYEKIPGSRPSSSFFC